MNRRDFNRLAVGAGLGSVMGKPTLAQMSTVEVQSPPATSTSQSVTIKDSPRTYNQVTIPRKYTAGKQRVSVYWTWSYPLGIKQRFVPNGQPLLDDDRGAANCLAFL